MMKFPTDDAPVEAYFHFEAPSKKAYAELKQELEELEARQETWSPQDVARYCLLQDALQTRMRRFKRKIEVIDGDKE
jgi:hypothetical protein